MHPKKKKKRGCFPCPLLLSLSTLVSTACFLSAEEGEAEKGGEREGGACKTQTSLEKLEKSAPALRQIAEAQAKVCCRKRFRFLSAPLCWRMINKDFIFFFFPLLIVTTCELQMEGLGREKKKNSVWLCFPGLPLQLGYIFLCLPVHFHGTFGRFPIPGCSKESGRYL